MSSTVGKSPCNMLLRGTKFYYRRVIPDDIYGRIGMSEIRISLQTSDKRDARLFSSLLNSYVESLFRLLRMVQVVNDEEKLQIREIVTNWIHKKKEEILDLRAAGMSDLVMQIDGETGMQMQTTSEEKITALKNAIELEQEKLRGNVLSETWIEEVAARLALDNGLTVPSQKDQISEEAMPYRRLCLELREAFVAIASNEIERITNGNSGNYEEIVKQRDMPIANTSFASSFRGKNQVEQGKRLSDLLKSYVQQKRNKDLAAKSVSEIESKCRLFVEIVKDPLIEEFDDQIIYGYLEGLKKMPARHTVSKKYSAKTVQTLLNMKSIPEKDLMKEETLRNHINKVKSFIQWLEKRSYLSHGRYSSLIEQKKRTRRLHEAKDVFSDEDLKIIFHHEDYLKFKKPWEFWLPLIALFTGMRLNEICQLYLDDIIKEGNIWYFNICPGELKSLKTDTAQRIVPLHEELIELRLPEYVMLLRKQGKTQLFPDLFGHKTPPSHTPGRKINAWFKKIGIHGSEKKGKKTFHSFRHTFRNRTKELNLSSGLSAEIVGHSEGRGSMEKIYAKLARTKQLYDEVISKVFYDLDLTHLKEYMNKMGDDPWDKKQKRQRKK